MYIFERDLWGCTKPLWIVHISGPFLGPMDRSIFPYVLGVWVSKILTYLRIQPMKHTM